MHPLLRRNNNLQGDLVDLISGRPRAVPFFLCAKAVGILQRRSVTPRQTATLTYAAAICRFHLSKGARMCIVGLPCASSSIG
jgi:hypothetical protein